MSVNITKIVARDSAEYLDYEYELSVIISLTNYKNIDENECIYFRKQMRNDCTDCTE